MHGQPLLLWRMHDISRSIASPSLTATLLYFLITHHMGTWTCHVVMCRCLCFGYCISIKSIWWCRCWNRHSPFIDVTSFIRQFAMAAAPRITNGIVMTAHTLSLSRRFISLIEYIPLYLCVLFLLLLLHLHLHSKPSRSLLQTTFLRYSISKTNSIFGTRRITARFTNVTLAWI